MNSQDSVSSATAILFGVVIASLYVVVLYLAPYAFYTGYPRSLPRSHKVTIKRRCLGVSLYTLFSFVFAVFLSSSVGSYSRFVSLFVYVDQLKIIRSCLITFGVVTLAYSSTFLQWGFDLLTRSRMRIIRELGVHGPGYDTLLSLRNVSGSLLADFWNRARELESFRDFVVGPVSEEIVFRGCLVPFFVWAGWEHNHIILWTPWLFGLAHLHHILEVRHSPWRAIRARLLDTLFQVVYTSVFGMFETFILIRTGAVLPPILAHMYCNIMSIPEVLPPSDCRPARRWITLGTAIFGFVMFGFGLFLFPSSNTNL